MTTGSREGERKRNEEAYTRLKESLERNHGGKWVYSCEGELKGAKKERNYIIARIKLTIRMVSPGYSSRPDRSRAGFS